VPSGPFFSPHSQDSTLLSVLDFSPLLYRGFLFSRPEVPLSRARRPFERDGLDSSPFLNFGRSPRGPLDFKIFLHGNSSFPFKLPPPSIYCIGRLFADFLAIFASPVPSPRRLVLRPLDHARNFLMSPAGRLALFTPFPADPVPLGSCFCISDNGHGPALRSSSIPPSCLSVILSNSDGFPNPSGAIFRFLVLADRRFFPTLFMPLSFLPLVL